MIVASDVGGTKTVLGLFEETPAGLRAVAEETYRNAEFATYGAVLDRFLGATGVSRCDAACFAIAGPVLEGVVRMVNLPWVFETAVLARRLGTERVRFLNDLEAAAYGMLHLAPEEFCELQPGGTPRRRGNIGLIAAGTGLGEALLVCDGRDHHPMASEGGHADFAPRSDEEIELLRWLRTAFGGHVSSERILSGPGLVNVYRFLRDTGRGVEPPALATRIAAGDAAGVIAAAALAGEYPICVAALETFASIYGAAAGNLALRGFTVGGLYVGGGIAPKILPKLTDGRFVEAFLAKGRYADFLREIRVAVALNSKAPLIGAANFARRL
jgi:glucokinase